MRKQIVLTAFLLAGLLPAAAQTGSKTDRIGMCKENYRTLFGDEALTGQGYGSGDDGHSPEIHIWRSVCYGQPEHEAA